MNIVLIGFMGSGKSSVARAISEKTGMAVVDLDAEIEKAARKAISEIFETVGETGFRELEVRECAKASKRDGVVVSCGGGVVLNRTNVLRLKKNGKIFWLKTGAKEISRRVSGEPAKRPLLEGRSSKEIRKMLRLRQPLYESAADFTVATDRRSVEEVADRILEAVA